MPLADVKILGEDPGLAMVLRLIGSGRREAKLATGVYLRTNWSFHYEFGWKNDFLPDSYEYRLFEEFGVCDSWEQVAERHAARFASDKPYCIALVELNKADEPDSGGWRWHKWGEYIGTQDPQCEYLAHEPVIERVYTYHVYELEQRHLVDRSDAP